MTQPRRPPRIVVGIDGSDASKRALQWASRWASRDPRGQVIVTTAWSDPAWSELLPLQGPDPNRRFERKAQHVAEQAAAEVVGEGLPVEIRVRYGPAARVLLDASVGADLLVLGARGAGGFVALLLGSVAQQCVSHARCPVAIIR